MWTSGSSLVRHFSRQVDVRVNYDVRTAQSNDSAISSADDNESLVFASLRQGAAIAKALT